MTAYAHNGFVHDRCDIPDRRLRPRDHDDRKAKLARSRDLAVGGLAATVLGDNDLDTVRKQKRVFVGFRKRSAIEDVIRAGDPLSHVHRLDAAHDVAVLRAGGESTGFLTTDREKHRARRFAEQRHSLIGVPCVDPVVAKLLVPWRSLEAHKWHGGGKGSLDSIGGDTCSKRMSGVDKHVDMPCPQPVRQPLRATEAPDAQLASLRQRIFRSAGKRQRHAHIAARDEAAGKRACLAGAAEDENMRDGHDAI